jgi:hypothetical protein
MILYGGRPMPSHPFKAFVLVAALGLAACNKMSPEECTKLRDSAFELINSANMCSTDADCKPSEWPGCVKPVNATNFDKIHAMMESTKKGKCEEKPTQCKPAPQVYCQEGICGFRYKAMPGADMRLE